MVQIITAQMPIRYGSSSSISPDDSATCKIRTLFERDCQSSHVQLSEAAHPISPLATNAVPTRSAGQTASAALSELQYSRRFGRDGSESFALACSADVGSAISVAPSIVVAAPPSLEAIAFALTDLFLMPLNGMSATPAKTLPMVMKTAKTKPRQNLPAVNRSRKGMLLEASVSGNLLTIRIAYEYPIDAKKRGAKSYAHCIRAVPAWAVLSVHIPVAVRHSVETRTRTKSQALPCRCQLSSRHLGR